MLQDLQEQFLSFPEPVRILIAAILSGLIGVLFMKLGLWATLRRFRRATLYIRDSIKKHLGGRMKTFLPLLFFYISLSYLRLDESAEYLLGKFVLVLLILNFGWILLKTLNVFEDVFFEAYKVRRDKYLKERKIRTQIQFLKRASSILIGILILAAILLSFEEVQKVGATLLTSTAVLGIVIGLAAQKTLGNLIFGFQIAFTQPVRIDDTVVVEGEWGTVEEITLTYAVVRVWDKRRLILPISHFIEKPFQNWTRNSEDLIGEVELPLDHRMPLEPLREKMHEFVRQNPLWDREHCKLQVVDSTEQSMKVRALVSAEDSQKAWDLKCELREALITFIKDRYPQYLPKIRAELYSDKEEGKGERNISAQ